MSIDSIHQLLTWKPPYIGDAFISSGILLPCTRMIVFGAAGSWKSMLAMYTAVTIAEGKPWFGFQTRKATIFKVQAELPKYMDRERLEIYVRSSGLKPANVYFKTPEDRLKLDTTWGANELSRDINEVKQRSPNTPVVVLLDPLKDLMAGKITDEYDVRKFQDNVNQLIQKHSITVVIFHHPRKRHTDESGSFFDAGAEESLGSNHWFNWCDTMIKTNITNPYAGSDIIEYRWEKHRNARRFLETFTVQWNRNTLMPTLISKGEVDLQHLSIRNLESV